MARSLRFQDGLKPSYWGECVLKAAHLINRLPSSVIKNKTPSEQLFGEPADYNILKVFRCLAFACNPKHSSDKLEMRGVPCVHLGYPSSQKGYRLLDLTTSAIFISRDVVFHEKVFPLNPNSKSNFMKPIPAPMPCSAFDDVFLSCDKNNEEIEDEVNSEDIEDNNDDVPQNENETTGSSPQPSVRRSTRTAKMPQWMEDFVLQKSNLSANIVQVASQPVRPQFHCFLANITKAADPVSFKQAIEHPHWINAMNEELNALEKNETWEVVTLPPGKRAIRCKWLFKTKYNPDGTIERYKSRLVVLGCR